MPFQNPKNQSNKLWRRDWILLDRLRLADSAGWYGTVDHMAAQLSIDLDPLDGPQGFDPMWNSLARLARIGYITVARDQVIGAHYRVKLDSLGSAALKERIRLDSDYAKWVRSHGLVDLASGELIRR